MGSIERLSLDADTVCTASVAFLSWRAAHERRIQRGEVMLPVGRHVTPCVPSISGLYPYDDAAIVVLFFANFVRIWAEIENALETQALRVTYGDVHAASQCDMPHIVSDDGDKLLVDLLIPSVNQLATRARQRCVRRLASQALMCDSMAAYGNAIWRPFPDPNWLFAARFSHRPYRNTYIYVSV
jgi:hypothetical protein